MKLYAISDLHLGYARNRQVFAALAPHPDDWLILAGDIGETREHLEFALRIATRRFATVLWVPGNHDLWTTSSEPAAPRGVDKYRQLVALCRHHGVLTPRIPSSPPPALCRPADRALAARDPAGPAAQG